MILRGLGGG